MNLQRKCAIAFCCAIAVLVNVADFSRAADSSDLVVILDSSVDRAQFATDHGLTLKSVLKSDLKNAKADIVATFSARSPAAAKLLAQQAKNDKRVKLAFVDRPTTFSQMSFSPNDPFFANNFPDASYRGQWYLENQVVPGRDISVRGAWNNNITGLGVTIGIVDDGLERTHEDLAPNYSPAYSYDFRSNDSDPLPTGSNNHGTSVAGIVAARGGNGIGVTGVAPYALLAGLRVSFEIDQTLAMFVNASLYQSNGSTQNIQVKNHSYSENAPFLDDTPLATAQSISAAAGTINVFSAGNFRGGGAGDTGKLQLQSNPDVITVAAMAGNGTFASYSNFGASVFVTAPSNGVSGYGMTTTDRTGAAGYNTDGMDLGNDKYTSGFGGTSAAAPVVSGVMALGKQVNPNMDTRMAKHLLVLSSNIINAGDATATSDGGWKTNGAGIKFNQNYGFGLVDANEFTQLAGVYSGVSPLQTESIGTTAVSTLIPDNNPLGLSRTFNITATTPLEEILVTLDISHTSRGQLEALITSPMNTQSRLFSVFTPDTGDNIVDWTFTDNAFWGENPFGTWTLMVRDTVSGTTGTWNDFSFTARMGTLVVPEPSSVVMLTIFFPVLMRRGRRQVKSTSR